MNQPITNQEALRYMEELREAFKHVINKRVKAIFCENGISLVFDDMTTILFDQNGFTVRYPIDEDTNDTTYMQQKPETVN